MEQLKHARKTNSLLQTINFYLKKLVPQIKTDSIKHFKGNEKREAR